MAKRLLDKKPKTKTFQIAQTAGAEDSNHLPTYQAIMSTTSTSSTMEPNSDRIQLVPPHIGDHILPNDPLFAKLLRHARRNRLAIRDNILKVEKSYGGLLADVLAYRTFLESSLDVKTLNQLERNDEIYIGVLAAGGYEFTVAVLAVYALGAAVVPMSEFDGPN